MASGRRRLYFPNAYAARDEIVIALDALLVLSKFRFIVSKKEVATLQGKYRVYQPPDLPRDLSPRDLLDDIMNLVYTVLRKKIWWLFIPKYFFVIKQDHTFDGIEYLSDAYSKEYLQAKLFKALRYSGIGVYR
jgi:hypothetical protein